MFFSVASFEFRYQLRQPLFWIAFTLFFLLTFGAITLDDIQIGAGGNTKANSPFAIAQTLLVMAVFAMFVTTAFVANVIVRDDESGFGAIVRATRVSKFSYLLGRFLGAFAISVLVYLAVPLAMMLGAAMPWLDPETIGPFRPDHYAFVFAAIILPTLFLQAAGFFTAATITRSLMGAYVCVAGFLVAYIVLLNLAASPERREIVALLEPFGIGAFGNATRFYTTIERNTQLPALAGTLLINRGLAIALGLGFLAAAYLLFRFEKKGRRLKISKKAARIEAAAAGLIAPRITPDPRAGLGQLLARTRFEAFGAMRHPAFLVLLMLGCINALGGLLNAAEIFGTPIYAVSRVMISTLQGAFTLFPLLIAIYYAGELVWRERDKRVHEIIGASPAPDWSLMVPKVLAITLVLAATLAVATLTAMIIQMIKQAPLIETWNYFNWYVLPSTIDLFTLVVLCIFVQVLVPSKFFGYAVMILYLVLTLVANQLGVDHNLLIYGNTPPVPLSDMNGQGQFAAAAAWFRAYWSAIALILLVFCYALWSRGVDSRLAPRLARLTDRLRGGPGLIFGGAAIVAVALGGFIFYNTNVLNPYRNNKEGEHFAAAYEKRFLKYENLPQPTIKDVRFDLQLWPKRAWLDAAGEYTLENRTNAPIETVHVRMDRDAEIAKMELDGAGRPQRFKAFGYWIFPLDQPMQPGETRQLRFAAGIGQKGFENGGVTRRIVANGSFLSNFEFAPVIGMDRGATLQDRAVRRRNGLPPELRVAKLEDDGARAHAYLRKDSDWVTAKITLTSDADQTAIAPGKLTSETVKDGRRTSVFITDAPVQNFFSIQSARYVVEKAKWNDVDLGVYYDPRHKFNVARMLDAMKKSLDYYSANFSPYQFKQARVIEFPAYATFAQAFANTMPFSEGIGFIADNRDPEDIDYAYYVTAHEMAHQWWAHQIIGADMQGATLLSETLAQYSALMVMKHTYGEDQIRRFLKFELDNYLRSRGGDVLQEQPLYRVENQQYIHYRKGSLVMYLLQDRIGEAAVNRALKRLLQAYAFKGPPYPRSLDLIALLREEAGPQHQDLITDLFEKITLFDVKVKKASAMPAPGGGYDVSLEIEAKKLYADGEGDEKEAPLSDIFDIGVFTSEPGDKAFAKANVLLFEPRPISSGTQTIRLHTATLPSYAGVDPYNKRIDRNSNDNVIKVEPPPKA